MVAESTLCTRFENSINVSKHPLPFKGSRTIVPHYVESKFDIIPLNQFITSSEASVQQFCQK